MFRLVSIDSIGHIELTSGKHLNPSVAMSIIDICKSLSTSKSSGCFSAFVFRTAIFIPEGKIYKLSPQVKGNAFIRFTL